ncbi:ATP-binding protein [Phytohabitans rumicis]|uniref:ATP-binding protein n=1 Tax=Phytohabitans rumicis TaxID=1076125 RepID=UPI003530B89F
MRRHAGAGATATVTIGYGGTVVTVEVVDDGVGGPASSEADNGAEGAGNGIAGMRARASALGGTLSAGPVDGGGFRVAVTLPWEGARD